MTGPLLPDVGVLARVPDEWDDPHWMPRHHLLSRLGRYFWVIWLDPPLSWRDPAPAPERRGTGSVASPAGQPAGFLRYRPGRMVPQILRPRAAQLALEWARLAVAMRALERRGARRRVLYLWRPDFAGDLRLARHDLSCYHVDDEYTFSPVDLATPPGEATLLKRVHQVFVHSEGLWEKKGWINPHTVLVPNGVDYHAYATPRPEPADLAPIPRPRIGYSGFIKEQLDLGLLDALARRHPEWSFVLVGPTRARQDVEATMDGLMGLPNVFALGPRRWHELPAYVQGMDVCTMGYLENGYTRYIYPLKLHEYLAAGRPVVASPIRSVRPFGELVRLARGADEWSAALAAALAEPVDGAAAARRRSVARRHDWEVLARQVAGVIAERLGSEYAARLERLAPAAPEPALPAPPG